jgi:hypothetical protein
MENEKKKCVNKQLKKFSLTLVFRTVTKQKNKIRDLKWAKSKILFYHKIT